MVLSINNVIFGLILHPPARRGDIQGFYQPVKLGFSGLQSLLLVRW